MNLNKGGINLSNHICKSRVTQQQPTAWSNSICLVLELFGIHFVKITETKIKLKLENVHAL